MGYTARIVLAVGLAAGTVNSLACSGSSLPSPVAQLTPVGGSIAAPQPNLRASPLPTLPSDPAGQGRVLSDYFKTHKLPLVGASVVADRAGREVILYGFVATPAGKLDAQEDAQRIINDPAVAIVNRIVVRSELLETSESSDSSGLSASAAQNRIWSQLPAYQSYPAPDQIQQYEAEQQPQPKWTSWVLPLLMTGLMFVP